jgi:hypothetical protein
MRVKNFVEAVEFEHIAGESLIKELNGKIAEYNEKGIEVMQYVMTGESSQMKKAWFEFLLKSVK